MIGVSYIFSVIWILKMGFMSLSVCVPVRTHVHAAAVEGYIRHYCIEAIA